MIGPSVSATARLPRLPSRELSPAESDESDKSAEKTTLNARLLQLSLEVGDLQLLLALFHNKRT